MSNIENLGKYDSGFSFKKILFWFIFIVVIISIVASYFTLSKATITLVPKVEEKEINMEVTVDSNIAGIDYENNSIRGVLLKEESVGKKTAKGLPQKKIKQKAVGLVFVKNEYSRAVGLRNGDILIYKKDTPQEIQIEITQDQVVYANQTREVTARATVNGLEGEIGPGEFWIEKYNDYMNEKVSVWSEQNFRDSIRTATIVEQVDVDKLKADLTRELIDKNFEKINSKLREGEKLNRAFFSNNVNFFNASVAPPVETDNFEIQMGVTTIAPVFQETDFIALIEGKLKNNVEGEQEFLDFNYDQIEVSASRFSMEEGKAVLEVKAKGRYRSKLSSDLFNSEQIKGYNERALEDYYSDFGDLADFRVDFWPDFRKTVPEMDSRIIIQVEN